MAEHESADSEQLRCWNVPRTARSPRWRAPLLERAPHGPERAVESAGLAADGAPALRYPTSTTTVAPLTNHAGSVIIRS